MKTLSPVRRAFVPPSVIKINLKSIPWWWRVNLWWSHLPLKWEAGIEEWAHLLVSRTTTATATTLGTECGWTRELGTDSSEKSFGACPDTGLQPQVQQVLPCCFVKICLKVTLFVPWWYSPLVTAVICFSAACELYTQALWLSLWQPERNWCIIIFCSFFLFSSYPLKKIVTVAMFVQPFMFRETPCIHYPINSRSDPVKYSCGNEGSEAHGNTRPGTLLFSGTVEAPTTFVSAFTLADRGQGLYISLKIARIPAGSVSLKFYLYCKKQKQTKQQKKNKRAWTLLSVSSFRINLMRVI